MKIRHNYLQQSQRLDNRRPTCGFLFLVHLAWNLLIKGDLQIVSSSVQTPLSYLIFTNQNPDSTLRMAAEKSIFVKNCLEAFCFRPKESILLNRGNDQSDQSYRFDMPLHFIADELKGIIPEGLKPNTQVLPIDDVKDVSQLEFVSDVAIGETFSTYIPRHSKTAVKLLYFLKDVADPKVVMDYLVYLHDRCNPYLLSYVISVLVLNRVEEMNWTMPDYFHLFPELFINGGSYNKALTAVAVEPTEVRSMITLEDQFIVKSFDPELAMVYFREDVSLNVFHTIFNRVYPTDGPLAYVARRRRGEIFYYTYQQLIARYNMERMSNALPRVKRLKNFSLPIKECYFPKLNSKTTSSNWPGRMKNRCFADLDRKDLVCDLTALSRWRDRILEAIDHGFAIMDEASIFNISNDSGIDTLGQAIQSVPTSPHHVYFGNMCTMGLLFLGYINDPDGRHEETHGVAADPSTTLRDPATYRWLALIIDMLQTHKEKLPKYTPAQLGFAGVKLKAIHMSSELQPNVLKINEFFTYYRYHEVELSSGFDYTPREPIQARFRQIDHKSFSYQITITNSNTQKKNGTVRIFMLPKFDEKEETMTFAKQRKLAIEMDHFPVTRK